MNKRNINKPAALVLALCALSAPSAQAIELGKIVIFSKLGEPLNASVPLGDAGDRMPSGIRAHVASAETYASAGIKRPEWADRAVLTARMIDKDRLELKIATAEPVEAPASSLIIEVTIAGEDKSMAREYAIILDPAEQTKAMESGSERPRAVSKGRVPNPNAGTGAKAEKPQLVGQGGDVVVKSGQVLYAIAKSKQPEGVSIERMMIGILRANPNAFISGNINRMKAGAILRMPASPELEAIRQAEAISEVRRQAGEFSMFRYGAAAKAAPVDAKASARASGKIAPMAQNPDKSDVLKIGKPSAVTSKASNGADAVSKQHELEESQAQVKDLERMRDDLQKLLTIKDKQLADAQTLAKKSTKAEAKPEVKAEAKPEVKAEAKPEVKAEAKPEVKAEAKPEVKAEAKPEVKAEAKPEVKAEEKPEVKTEAKPEMAPETKPEVAPEVKVEEVKPAPVVPVAKPKPVVVTKPAVEEPTIAERVMGAFDAFGIYIAGGLAALVAAAALFAAKKRKGRDKMLATTISPDSGDGMDMDPKASPSELEERINAADTYIAFEQPEKATRELEAALALSPANLDALIRLARIASKKKDRGGLGRVGAEIGDATLKSGPYWDEVESLLGHFAKEDTKPASPVAPVIMPFDLGMDLERSLSDLAVETPKVPEAIKAAPLPMASNEVIIDPSPLHTMDFEANLGAGTIHAAEPHSNAKLAADEPSFDLPMFDMPSATETTLSATTASEVKKETSFAPEPLESISFDMGLPDDKASSPLHTTSESLSLDAPMEPAASVSEADREMGTMYELAKAYKEMGDKDGAKELLVEISQNGSPKLSAMAKEMLADL